MYKLNRFNRNKECLKYAMPFARILSVQHFKETIGVLVNKDGSMQVSWMFRGPDLDSSIPEQLAVITQQLNAMFSSLHTGWAFYFEAQRVTSTGYATDVYFPDPISKGIDIERKNFFSDGQHFESNYYATAWWMPPSETQERMKEFVVEGRKHKEMTQSDVMDSFFEQIDKIYSIFNILRIPSSFLSADELLTYIHSTVSDNSRKLTVPTKPLLMDQYLYDCPLYGGLEPRIGNKLIRVVVPIGFPRSTVFGNFNALNRMNFGYRWVTRFFPLGKQDCVSALEGVQRGWNGKLKSIRAMIKELIMNQAGDGSVNMNAQRKFNETTDAIAAVESDITSFGYYSTAVIVMDEDEDTVDNKAKLIRQMFINLGYKAKIEDLNSVDAWMGSIPGDVGHNIRQPIISTGNLVHMMPISDIWAGPTWNAHLQAPVLLYTQTDGNTPFRLSLHVGDVGHTFVVGPTGAGKSVFLNMLSSGFRKYKNSRVFIFDKGASSRILTEGVGGKFYDLGNESQQISFQPLAHVDDEKERQWALEWLCDYARAENIELTPDKKKLIWNALQTLANAQQRLRTITMLVNTLQSGELKTVFKQLSIEGSYGAVFDSNQDNLSFSTWQAFEMEKLMDTRSIIGPTLMYIFHRIEQQLNGEPTVIILDECWVFFDNPMFVEKIREWLKVLRKFNASVIFATQSLADITQSPIFSTILESCQSRIFLPNDKALEKTSQEKYETFGLNKKQIQIIASAIPKRHYYYTSPLGCRLFDLGLDNCPMTLAYVAVNKQDLIMATDIIGNYGHKNFNEHWLKYKNVEYPTAVEERKYSL